MNRNKFLFAFVAVITVLFGASYILHTRGLIMSPDRKIPILRMGTNFFKSAVDLDPANISTAEEYELTSHLFGRLVQYQNQKLEVDLAESFYWTGEQLVFEFANSPASSSGLPITAEDAYYSLKRALYLKKTGHGDLRNLLCPGQAFDSIEDDCPGIKLDKNKLVLTPFKSALRAFLLPFLESADFAIVPKRDIDLTSKDLRITSRSDTTGAYFVSKDAADGAWTLTANKFSKKYSAGMPQTIQLVPANHWDVFEKLQRDEIDYAPSFLAGGWNEKAYDIYRDHAHFNIFKSMPIKVWMICFTPRAIANSSVAERMFAAQTLAELLRKILNAPDNMPTIEFFQGMSDGNITDEQRKIITDQRRVTEIPRFKQPLQLAVPAERFEFYKESLKDHPEIEVVNTKVGAYLLPVEQRLDMYVVATDSAWNENISLLGHNLGNTFHLPGLDAEKWLTEYTQTEDKQSRIDKLRDLHFKMLRLGVIYPVLVSPYLTYSKKPWAMNFDPFSSESMTWQMRIEP